MSLLTDRQKEHLSVLFAHEKHAAVEAAWEIYQAMVAAYREFDRAKAKAKMEKVIAALSKKVPDTLEAVSYTHLTLPTKA